MKAAAATDPEPDHAIPPLAVARTCKRSAGFHRASHRYQWRMLSLNLAH